MVKNTEKVYIITRQEESIKESGSRIENTVMELWNMQIKTDTRVIGLKAKGQDKVRTNTQMETLIRESGRTIQKMDMVFCKWQREIFTRVIG